MLPSPTHEDIPGPALRPPPGVPAADHRSAHRVLEQIQALVDGLTIQPLPQPEPQDEVTRLDPHDAAVHPALATLVRQASTTVDAIVCPGDVETTLRTLLTQVTGAAQTRLLCAPSTADQAVLACSRLRPSRTVVRVSSVPLPEVFLADDRSALVRCTRTGGHGAALVRSPHVVRSLRGLFGGLWRAATPALDHREVVQWMSTSQMARQVLLQMGRGSTDEAAARELAMSVRTYRRHVAELMRVLGASSRFQAGARAARLGLISSSG